VKIGIIREKGAGETRVAVVPADVRRLVKKAHEVVVETGAGAGSSFGDDTYQAAGARILPGAEPVMAECDVAVKVEPPTIREEILLYRKDTYSISLLSPFKYMDNLRGLQHQQVTAFALELMPRISRAQSMDVLSSMATLAGYKAVLMAADMVSKIFPLLMTAAGTIPPATVLVLGAGVAGLSAIATAKRLGAKVEAFDPRPVVKEQVMSLGAQFIDMDLEEDVETAGGYAKMQSAAFLKAEQDVIATRLPKIDVVITTAQIFGKAAPLLITEKMVDLLKPGSVVIDLAAEDGGNCALSEPGKTRHTKSNVRIIGASNLPAQLPIHASMMLSKNISTFILHIFSGDSLDFSDEIIQGTCVTRGGEIVHPMVKNIDGQEGSND
jgi:NAD(P) transhydrogenase subunit alpha